MRDLNDGRSLRIQSLEQLHDLSSLRGVQVTGRFVREYELRIRNHGARNRHELLLAAGELAGVEILLADNMKTVEGVGYDRCTLRSLDVAIRERDVEVLVDREIVEQVVLLEDESDVAFVQLVAVFDFEFMYRVVVQPVFSVPGSVQHAENAE